jgi:hypothetical protein
MRFVIVSAGVIAAAAGLAEAAIIHHWRLDEPDSSISTADSVGVVDGLLGGTAVLGAPGVAGTALENGHVEFNGVTAPIGGSFSIGFWARRGDTGDDRWIIGQGDDTLTRRSLHIGFRSADTFSFAFWNDDLDYDNAAVAGDTVNYHHWLVTFDAATRQRRIYLDGNAVASDTAGGVFEGSGTNAFWIGRRVDGNPFVGLMDDVQVYDRVLTGADAQFLFNNPGVAAPIPEPPALLLSLVAAAAMLLLARRARALRPAPAGHF